MNSGFDADSSEVRKSIDKNVGEPLFKFDEDPLTPMQVLDFWQAIHGHLSEYWRERFLEDPFVLEICTQHPAHIRRAIKYRNKLADVLGIIYEIKRRNSRATETMLDEFHPDHAIGITNAHLGNRTTDPFDPQRDELLFRCSKCNLKLHLRRKSTGDGSEDICTSCTGED